jgi:PAS domain S-box-containing protein
VFTTEEPTILLVDDEPDLLQLTSHLLEEADYQVLTASTGRDALRLAREHRPSLILLDVMLPDGNGIEICRQIKADPSLAGSLVMLLSASRIASETQAEGLEAGADGYIARPISNRELVARVQAMARLHEAEETLRRYEILISTIADPISFVDRNYMYVTVNDAYEQYANRPKGQVVGHSVAQVHGEDVFREAIKPRLDRCLDGHEVRYQAWFGSPALGRRFMDVRYAPVTDGGGSVIGVAVNARDITERKQVEESLRREHGLVNQVMETSPVGIVVVDSRGQIQFANAQVQRLSSLSRTQIVGAQFDDPRWRVIDCDGDTVPSELLPFTQVTRTRTPLYGIENSVEMSDGRVLDLSVNAAPLLGEAEALEGVVMTVEDITERKRTERALRASREFFQSALDALSSNIAVLDAQGRIVAVNASWRRFGDENGLSWEDGGIGFNYLSVLDASPGDDVDGASAAAHGLCQVIASERASYWQEYPCHSPWEKRWYTMSVTRFESSEGLRVVVSHENVTQRKLAELALRDAKEAAEAARADAEAARQEEEERRLEAERRRQIAESLRGALAVLTSTRSLQEVLDHIVVQAGQLLGSDAVAIYRAQEGADVLRLEAAHGLEVECMPPRSMPAATESLQQAIRSRHPVTAPDIRQRVGAPPHSPQGTPKRASGQDCTDRYRALLAVPIIVKDVPYGGLILYCKQPHVCSQEEVELAVVFGDQVALAIENARLQDQVEESAVAAERTRLARELHDAVTQTLFSASVIAETIPRIWDTHPHEAQRGLEELRQLTRGALAEMRTLLLELRPSSLTEKPLGDLLRNLTEATTSRTRVPVDLTVEGDAVLPPQVQIALYRIAQEALNNVVKHAGATEVAVSLYAANGDATLSVRDNGTGFHTAAAPPMGHFGVSIMRERAQQIGAALEIASDAGSGTKVTVRWRGEKGTIHEQA